MRRRVLVFSGKHPLESWGIRDIWMERADHNFHYMPLMPPTPLMPQLVTWTLLLLLTWALLHILEGWRHKGLVEGVPPPRRSVHMITI